MQLINPGVKRFYWFILILLLPASLGYSQPLRIAAAANTRHVIQELQADFKRKTGIETEVVVSSSGKLTAQIKNGAPFDIFLSADTQFPDALYKDGFSNVKPRVYALGSLVICSSSTIDLKSWKTLAATGTISKIAIANPVLAPYGRAAEETLQKLGLWEKVKSKIVFGESIAQVNAYISAGAVSLGFTSEAFLYENHGIQKLKWMRIEDKMYGKIEQSMILLSNAAKGNQQHALKFFNYLQSPAAKAILKKSGYKVP